MGRLHQARDGRDWLAPHLAQWSADPISSDDLRLFDLRERYRHSSWMPLPRMRAWFTLCHRETSQGTWLAARHGAADGIGTPRGGLTLRGHHGQRCLVQRHRLHSALRYRKPRL